MLNRSLPLNKLYSSDNQHILRAHIAAGTGRALYPDLSTGSGQVRSLGRATFKQAAVEDMAAEQAELRKQMI